MVRNKYFQYLHDIGLELNHGSFEKLVNACFVVFLLWIIAAFASVVQSGSFPVSRLRTFPFSKYQLFVMHAVDVFVDLFMLVMIAVSGGVLFPVANSGGPVLFLIVFFFLVCCGLLFFLLRTLALLSPFYAAVSGLLIVLISLPVPRLLNNSASLISPVSFRTILLLLLIDWLLLFISFWVFKKLMAVPETHIARRKKLWLKFPCPAPLSALLNKDIRYIFRILDGYLGIIVSLYFVYYLASEPNPQQVTLWVFIVIPFYFNSGLAINIWGIESASSMSRYLLSPLDGSNVFLSKNFSYFLLVSIQYIPILVLTVVRFGYVTGLTAVSVVLSIAIIDVIIGNYRSMEHHIETGFFRFTSDSSPKTVASLLLLIFIGDLPAFLALMLFRNFGVSFLIASMILSISLSVLYIKMIIPRQGKLFESMAQNLYQDLSP
ncbi:MAG: hypothetical protein GXO70_02945 [Acidobacteria bacterium]|nr:hypothetical protein [Acidobacteriota bacterium]